MYMATCRSCFFAPGVVPASPRIPLKTMNNGTKENVQVETNNLDKDDIIPYKKALFDTEQQEAIENAMWLTTTYYVLEYENSNIDAIFFSNSNAWINFHCKWQIHLELLDFLSFFYLDYLIAMSIQICQELS